MIEDFENVIYLFSCAVNGKKAERKMCIEFDALYSICIANGIWPTVFNLVSKTVGIPEKFSDIKTNTKNSIYNHMKRMINVANIVDVLEKNGIQCCILKGPTLSSLYAEPYSRISNDTDIYIKDYVDKACDILRENGFEIMDRWEGSHHIKCISKHHGMIELHTNYFDKLVEELWFDGAKCFDSIFIPFNFEGVECSTLDYTDGMLYNLLHFIKHYISGIVTVRQLMDNLLYLKKNGDMIDYNKLNHTLDDLNYKKFFEICIAFGIKYLQFKKEDFIYEINSDYDEETDLLLRDLYQSSINQDANIYDEYGENTFKKKNKSGSYNRYKEQKNNGGLLKMAKTNRKSMEEKYHILKKYKFLYPFFYVIRSVTGLYNHIFKKKRKEYSDRMSLIKKLGL